MNPPDDYYVYKGHKFEVVNRCLLKTITHVPSGQSVSFYNLHEFFMECWHDLVFTEKDIPNFMELCVHPIIDYHFKEVLG